MKRLLSKYPHAKWLLFWPAFGAAFYAVEYLIPGVKYHVMYHPLDSMIPFCEWFLIPYVYWYIFMFGTVAYTFLREQEAFRKLMEAMAFVFGGAILIFLIYPTCQNLRPHSFARDNILTQFMAWFYENCDTNTNVCPSLHVAGSLVCAIGLANTRRFSTRGWKFVNYGTAVLISVSTVFVKQHSVWDVFWGVVITFAAWLVVYKFPRMLTLRQTSLQINY